MPVLPSFDPPALQNDFSDNPALRAQLLALWNTNVTGWTYQAILGNPWTQTNSSFQNYYYNPLVTDIPTGAAPAKIAWTAAPGRIGFYFGNLGVLDQWALADTGFQTDGKTSFPPITTDPCSQQPVNKAYGPFGPRGFHDEYCEWSVTRDDKGNITRVDFTCENPEYWYTVWRVSPEKVLALYQETLGSAGAPNKNITLDDLCLHDSSGAQVIDPTTGRPAYNPLNKWNSGTSGSATSGGAMHLTSTPNTLQTEMQLAGGATVQRTIGNTDKDKLICCAQYGQPHRNSDPFIGQQVNIAVQGSNGKANRAALTNPSGLYIQMPNFSLFQLPSSYTGPKTAADFWHIVRGSQTLPGMPSSNNYILHAYFEVDPGLGFTVSDIQVSSPVQPGNPTLNIQYGVQIAETFQIAIFATTVPASTAPAAQPCVVALNDPPDASAFPQQLMPSALWNAYYAAKEPNPQGQPMSLASNTSMAATTVEQGQTGIELVLTCSGALARPFPEVSFSYPGSAQDITVKVASASTVSYAVPGNSYPSDSVAFVLALSVSPDAELGLRDIWVTNAGQQAGPPARALLNVVPSKSGAGLKHRLDKAYETKSPAELVKAPVEALEGVSATDAEALKRAFGITTIGELANNKYVRAAQQIVHLATSSK